MPNDIQKAVEFLKVQCFDRLWGIISTGSGQPADGLNKLETLELDYKDIPGMSGAVIAGQKGILKYLVCGGGNWGLWVGRRHFYQGFNSGEIGYYIDISYALGARKLICINAAGGLNPEYKKGDLVVIERFKSFIPTSTSSPGFDKKWQSTSPGLVDAVEEVANCLEFKLHRGSYIGVPGPTYETAADIEWLRKMGGDVVGMSTTPELQHALELGMEACAVSLVSNVTSGSTIVTHEEVVKSSLDAAGKIAALVTAMSAFAGKE